MRLFGKSKSVQPGAVINGEYVPNAVQPNGRRKWLGIIWRALLVVLVIVLLYLLFLFLRDVFGSKPKPTGKPGVPGQVNAPGESSTTNGSEIQVSQGGSSNPELTNNSKSNSSNKSGNTNSSSNNSSQSSANSQNLSNSGPGDVAKVFVITTAAGAIAYQVVVRRKLSAVE